MLKRVLSLVGRGIRETGQAIDRLGSTVQGNYAFKEQLSRHRRLQNFFDNKPKVGEKSFIAPNASVIGSVEVGDKTSVWYGAILRGDVSKIKIGSHSTIGDRTVVHGRSQPETPTLIGNHVTVEQGCILHACTIMDKSVVGMGSTVLDGAVVSSHAVVGPGSLVLEKQVIPAKQYWAGTPAKYVRDLSVEEIKAIEATSEKHTGLSQKHLQFHQLREDERAQLEHAESNQLPTASAKPQF
jgi:carbonic anhydrase/acetyltransferase-like protein (isoleucine patch superfamily)